MEPAVRPLRRNGAVVSVSRASNPNWRADAGLPPLPRCACGHAETVHVLVGNRGCSATMNQPTEWHRGWCSESGCKCRKFAKAA